MPDYREERLDRCLAGELSGPEQRKLARAALDDPDLFDLLITTGAMKAVVLHDAPLEGWAALPGGAERGAYRADGYEASKLSGAHRFYRRGFALALGGSVGAAALIFVIVNRSPETLFGRRAARVPPNAGVSDRLPTAAPVAARNTARPLVLATRLGEPHDPQVVAGIAQGDLSAARAVAERALSVAQSQGAADRRREALEQLGTVEYRHRAFADAERHLRSAQETLDDPPPAPEDQRARILNELGAVLIARGDYPGAEDVLRLAQSHAPGSGALAGHVANNLGALAALRGDTVKAESLYKSALGVVDGRTASSLADRSVIEKNLAALGSSR